MEDIIVGRDREDLEKYGKDGTALIGKHIVGKGEDAHLTNPIRMDVTRPHVLLVCGKRGTGKSYTSAVIAEEIAALPKGIKENLSVLEKVGEHTFRRVRKDDESLGEEFFFEVDDEGNVTRFLQHSNWETKVR